jgi:hypothetical protein
VYWRNSTTAQQVAPGMDMADEVCVGMAGSRADTQATKASSAAARARAAVGAGTAVRWTGCMRLPRLCSQDAILHPNQV